MKALSTALIQRPYRSEGFDYVSFDPIKLVAVINKMSPQPPSNPFDYNALATMPLVLLHRAKDSGTYEMLMDLFRKSGVSAKVIMHITQPSNSRLAGGRAGSGDVVAILGSEC